VEGSGRSLFEENIQIFLKGLRKMHVSIADPQACISTRYIRVRNRSYHHYTHNCGENTCNSSFLTVLAVGLCVRGNGAEEWGRCDMCG
jgi:hypothetical protein